MHDDQVEKNETKCKSGSKVGSGSATAVFSGQTINLTVKAYNGNTKGTKIYLLVQNAQFGINKALDGTLGKALPAVRQEAHGQDPDEPAAAGRRGLRDADRLQDQRRRHPARAPRTPPSRAAPRGKLRYKGVFNYSDGTSKTATTTSKCSK